jgi:hypothetical protein
MRYNKGDILIDIDSSAFKILSIKKCDRCGKNKYYGQCLETDVFGWWHENEIAGSEKEVYGFVK